jgi:hypothetical protein
MGSRTLLILAGLLACFPGPGLGEEAPLSSRFVSDWGRRVLSQTDLAAEGSLTMVRALPRGSILGTFRLKKIHWGEEIEKTVMVLSPDPHFFSGGERYLFFLKNLSGSRYEPVDLVDLNVEGNAPRHDVCKKIMEIEKLPTHMERIALFKELVLRNLADTDRWTRNHALRETYILSRTRPRLFTKEEVGRIEKLHAKKGKREFRRYLLSILTHLRILPPLLGAIFPRKEGDTVKGVGRLRALLDEKGISKQSRNFREEAIFDRFREEKNFQTRVRILRIVGYLGNERLVNGVIRALVLDPSPSVRTAAATALGSFRGRAVVEYLTKALFDKIPRVQTAALLSLRKIGDPSAGPTLGEFIESKAGTPEVLDLASKVLKELLKGK